MNNSISDWGIKPPTKPGYYLVNGLDTLMPKTEMVCVLNSYSKYYRSRMTRLGLEGTFPIPAENMYIHWYGPIEFPPLNGESNGKDSII